VKFNSSTRFEFSPKEYSTTEYFDESSELSCPLIFAISSEIFTESGVETIDDELSQAEIITGLRVIFFNVLIKGESNKNEIIKNDKNRSDIKSQILFLLSSLLSLFLKYIKSATPEAASIEDKRNINQYFMPNEINLYRF